MTVSGKQKKFGNNNKTKKEFMVKKVKTILCFVFCILCTITAIAQDKRATIKDYLNQEILIVDSFAGQSVTLIKENKDYFILRKYFGSGIPVISSIKYKVVLLMHFGQVNFFYNFAA